MHDIHEKTSLIKRLFRSYTIPEGPFDPGGNWEHKYYDLDTYFIISNPKKIVKRGDLTIERVSSANRTSRLNIILERYCTSGFHYFLNAGLNCVDDPLCTPTRWHYESRVARRATDTPYLLSGLKKYYRVRNGRLFVNSNGASWQRELSGAYTCKLNLLDAVQRMPKSTDTSFVFTIFDEFDSISKGQTFRYRESAKVKTAHGSADVFCFEHLGRSSEPATYWVDTSGRLLFYLSGMELLILGEENGKQIVPFSSFE